MKTRITTSSGAGSAMPVSNLSHFAARWGKLDVAQLLVLSGDRNMENNDIMKYEM